MSRWKQQQDNRGQGRLDLGSGLAAQRPAVLGNTAGSNRQTLETGGLDWLEVRCWGEWDKYQHRLLCDSLRHAQEAARAADDEGAVLEMPCGSRAVVRRGGAPDGTAYMHYVVEIEGIVFRLSENWEWNENRPQIGVLVGSLPLMVMGHVGAWAFVRETLDAWGFCLMDTIVSRIDLCTDHAGVDVHEYAWGVLAGRCVKRTKHDGFYREGERITGYETGKQTRVRLYCKATEVKGDEAKQEVLIRKRWGAPQKVAMRVEFQLRRESLRNNFDVRTVEEVFENLGTIAEWCAREWFRITDEEVDRQNSQRFGPGKKWQAVIKAFSVWTGEAQERRQPVRVKASAERLIKQGVGCLEKALAVLGCVPGDTVELFERLAAVLQPYTRDSVAKIGLKRLMVESATPAAERLPVPCSVLQAWNYSDD